MLRIKFGCFRLGLCSKNMTTKRPRQSNQLHINRSPCQVHQPPEGQPLLLQSVASRVCFFLFCGGSPETQFLLDIISRQSGNIFCRGVGTDVCRIVGAHILMMVIMGEFQILGMIRNSVPKINDLQRYQEGKRILEHIVVCHCHENRGQCKFRIGIEKVKDEGCGKRGWSTAMMHRVNGTTDGGAMQKVGVGRGEDELVTGEGHEDARYEGHVQTRRD